MDNFRKMYLMTPYLRRKKENNIHERNQIQSY